jgi:cysteine desulfurase
MKPRVYLDWASAAPVSDTARRVFTEALAAYGNPSSPHAEGEQARTILENARTHIARLASIKPEGVIFTSGATEANNLAIQGAVGVAREAMQSLSNSQKASDEKVHVLYLPTSHASVVETMEALGKVSDKDSQGGYEVEVEALHIKNGEVDLVELRKQLRAETVLLSMDLVCGETGTLWATRDVRRVLNAFERETFAKTKKSIKILLHVDASQAPLVESINCNQLGADLLTLDAQKVGAVRGIGVLLRVSPLISLKPLMQGGGQEQGLRPGTENPALAAAFSAALQEAQAEKEKCTANAARWRAALLSTIQETYAEFPRVLCNVGKESVPHIVNISLPGIDTDYAVMLLSEAGFAVSTKSACETNEEGSRVVSILMAEEQNKQNSEHDVLYDLASRASSTLRISWGPTTTEKDLQRFAKELIRTIEFLLGAQDF